MPGSIANALQFGQQFAQAQQADKVRNALQNFSAQPDQTIKDVAAIDPATATNLQSVQANQQKLADAKRNHQIQMVQDVAGYLQSVPQDPQSLSVAYDKLGPVLTSVLDMSPEDIADTKNAILANPGVIGQVHTATQQALEKNKPADVQEYDFFASLPPEGQKAYTEFHQSLKAPSTMARPLTPDEKTSLGVPSDEPWVLDRNGVPRLPQGYTPKGSGALSEDAIDYAADQYELTGKIPALGRGSASAATRAAIVERAAEKASARGDTGASDLLRQKALAQKGVALNDLARNSPSSAGGLVKSANALLSHLDLLSEAAQALNNGDVQKLNQVKNAWSREFGGTAPTNFNAIRNIFSAEFTKFLVGSGGSLTDRQEVAADFNSKMSPDQLSQVVNKYKGLVAGQLNGAFTKYQGIGLGDQFVSVLTPQARQFLALPETQGSSGSPDALGAPESAGASPPPPSGQEGLTATNPQTGAKLILKGGQWQPVQ